MSNKINVPNFVRPSAAELVLEQRVSVLSQLNGELITLMAAEFPSLKDKFNDLMQKGQTAMGQLNSLAGELILQGHGPRGVLASKNLLTAKENTAFIARFPKPVEKPVNPQELMAKLETYLAVDGASEKGRGFNIPEESLYGVQYKDATAVADSDLLLQADGVWVLTRDEQTTYTLKLTVGEHVLLFSPMAGPSLVTYSEIEKRWVQHNGWALVDGAAVLAAVDAFFDKTNVRDATQMELNRLYRAVESTPLDQLKGLSFFGSVTGEITPDFELIMGEIFKVRLIAEGKHSIISTRDDVQWTDLTLQTRRRLFRDLVNAVAQVSPVVEAAPKAGLPAVKKVAKKAVKKTAARKAAKA